MENVGHSEHRSHDGAVITRGPDPQKYKRLLSEEEKASIAVFVHDWIQTRYKDVDTQRTTEDPFNPELNVGLARIVGESHAYAEGKLPKKYTEAVAIFLNDLIDFVDVQSRAHPTEKDKTGKFIENLQREMFEWSPSIINHMTIENIFFLTAKANRIPEIQGWFGQNMVGEMVYELSFCGDGVREHIVNKVSEKSIPDVLDAIHQMQTIGAQALANGEWAYPAYAFAGEFIDGVRESIHLPIVDYAAQIAIDRLDSEKENPTAGVVTYHGNSAGGRLHEQGAERIYQQNSLLQRQIIPNVHISESDLLVPVAKDAVGIIGHDGVTRYIGFVDAKGLSAGAKIPLGRAYEWKDYFQSIDSTHTQDRENILRASVYLVDHGALLSPNIKEGNGTFPVEEENLRRALSFNVERERIRFLTGSHKAHLVQEAENRNVELSHEAFRLFAVTAPEVLKNIPEMRRPVFAEDLEEFTRAIDAKEFDHAFGRMEAFCRGINAHGLTKRPPNLIDDQGLELMLSDLRGKHIQAWKDIDIAMGQFFKEHKIDEQIMQLNESAEEIDLDMLKETVLRSLVLAISEGEKEAKIVHFSPFVELPLDQIGKEHGQSTALLLSQLYRPAMRVLIENDLGIRFDDLSFRAQVQVLKYMTVQPEKGFSLLKQFAERYKLTGLNTFLSLEKGVRGEQIIALGDNMSQTDAETVFGKYSEIVSASEDIVSYIEQTFGGNNKESLTPGLVSEIREKMLRRGKDLLVRFAEKVERGEKISPDVLQKELERAKASNALFLSSLKSLHEAGIYTDLDEIKSISQDTLSGPEVPEEDKNIMRGMYARNYAKPEQRELQTFLLQKLEECFGDENTTFEIVRHDGEIRAFYRMTHVGSEKVYFGAFNVDPEFHGATLGETVLDQSVGRWGDNNDFVVEADAPAFAPINRKYIESGFIGTYVEDFHGVEAMKIFWNNMLNQDLFRSKTMSTDEIVFRANRSSTGIVDGHNISVWVGTKNDAPDHIRKMLSKKNGAEQFVLTRSFEITDETGKTQLVIVCEKVRDDHLVDYQTSTFSGRYDYPHGARKEGNVIIGPNESYFIV